MNTINVLLDTPFGHNLEVIGDYLCLFDSEERDYVKFLKLEEEHIREIFYARFGGNKGVEAQEAALTDIVGTRVQEWQPVRNPKYFLDTFAIRVMSHPESYAPSVCTNFEIFVFEYYLFWACENEQIVRTPYDLEPDEEQLRNLHEYLVEKLTPYLDVEDSMA